MLFEDFSFAKYPFLRSGRYTVRTEIYVHEILVVVAYGNSLEDAHISSYQEGSRGNLTFTIGDHLDINGLAKPQYLWVFIYRLPSFDPSPRVSSGSFLFGVAEIDFILNDDNPSANPTTSVIPNKALIPWDDIIHVNDSLPEGSHNAVELRPSNDSLGLTNPSRVIANFREVVEESPNHSTIYIDVDYANDFDDPSQCLVQVLSMNYRTQKVGKFWDGNDDQHMPINIKLDDQNPISLCAILKTNPLQGVHDNSEPDEEEHDDDTTRRDAVVTGTGTEEV